MGEREIVAVLEYDRKQYLVHMGWSHPDEDADDQEIERLAWYMWTDGNYSCDCNRLAFIACEYDDYPDLEDENGYPPCGETIKLVRLTLDGKDLLAPTVNKRLAAIGLVSYGGL